MPLFYNQVLMQWRDENGKYSTNFMTTLDQGSGGAGTYSPLAATMQACSDALLECIQFQTTILQVGTPEGGPYPTVWDRAVLLARIDGTNAPTRIEIPAPKAAILQEDTSLVNLEAPEIVALQSACIAVLGDPLGNPMGPFRRGIRTNAR